MAIRDKKVRWKILSERPNDLKKITNREIIDILLKNRKIENIKAYFEPSKPNAISLDDIQIEKSEVEKLITRIKKAKQKQEKVIVYGDYDADGICATAILWETLHEYGIDTSPYIPERLSEGYGINKKSLDKLTRQYNNLGLIITVDNGIVANKPIDYANNKGVDVVITDHHQKSKKIPNALAIIHTDTISGSAIAWFVACELRRQLKIRIPTYGDGLDLACIGTIADMIPLSGFNRSIVKHGLDSLNKTKRPGLISLCSDAGIEMGSMGTQTVSYMIAPRINAMGRLTHAMESLRLLCVRKENRAKEISLLVNKTNLERQKIVEEVVIHAKKEADSKTSNIIVIAHESYHEGVIGLAAGKLVEEFYRPAIVFSKGAEISKASARSISGFNIIETIRLFDDLIIEGGGHPMAAGFSIKTSNFDAFLQKISNIKIPEELLIKESNVDLELMFSEINYPLVLDLKKFEPFGLGNPTPSFITKNVSVLDSKLVGSTKAHLKLKLKNSGKTFSAIGFSMGDRVNDIKESIDIIYSIAENVYNGNVTIDIRLKDFLAS